MIQFKCLCNYPFEVPADRAGDTIQCPRCKRLNDIPTLSELSHLDDAGGFRLDAIPLAPEPESEFVRKSTRAYTRRTVDDEGEEIDLRPTLDEFLKAGTQGRPSDDADIMSGGTPKYDPFTGELIEPLNVSRDPKTDQPRDAIPIAKPAIGYARPGAGSAMTAGTALGKMFNMPNLFVVTVMTVISCMVHPFAVLSAAGLFLFVPVVLLFIGAILGHFCNVIEEIGPGEFDELPRPLRDLSFTEDIWLPFVRMTISLIICFGPAAIAFGKLSGDLRLVVGGVLGIIGLFFLPAVVLTSATSGAYNNLRPDRVFSVIRVVGLPYFLPLLMTVLGAPLYVGGLLATFYGLASLFGKGQILNSAIAGGGGIGSMFVGLLLLHYACWLLGLMYRAHHGQFAWVMQRFISTRRHDTMRQLEIRRAKNRRLAQTRTAAVRATPPSIPGQTR